MCQLIRNVLVSCVILGVSFSLVHAAELVDLEEIKSRLITESLDSETRVSTVSMIDRSGELKQYSRFYSTRQFSPNRYTAAAIDREEPDAEALSDSCRLTSYFPRLPRSFKTSVDLDLNGLSSNDAQQYGVINTESFFAALEERANEAQDESGLYTFSDFGNGLIPLSDLYTRPAGTAVFTDTWSGPAIHISVTPRISDDGNLLINYVENSVNSLTRYVGYDVSLDVFESLPDRVSGLWDSGRLSADITVTFMPDFDSTLESRESRRFSGNALELAEFLGGMVSRKFLDYAELDKCALEYYKPKMVTTNQLIVPSGLNAGVTQETQFLLLPGLPSEANALNSDILDNIKVASVFSLQEHETVIRVIDEENINLTGFSVIPL
jgi:hypothetical protein